MNQPYFAILTEIGEAKHQNAALLGVKVNYATMAVGDGNGTVPTPDRKQRKLVNQIRREAINRASIDPENPSQIIVEQVIPEGDGGWWIREAGVFDDAGDLIAVASLPPTYKPQMAEGSGRTQVIRIVLLLSNASVVSLKIDPAVVLATRQDVLTVQSALTQHIDAGDPHPQYAPKASPALTGKPTAPTASAATKTTQLATAAFVHAVVDMVVDSAPADLDTLKKLAQALGNDPNFAASVQDLLAKKADKSQLSAYATKASPALTGVPTAPTASTATKTTQLATAAFVHAVVAMVVDSAPADLDTLKKLAQALGNDPNFAASVQDLLAKKADKKEASTTVLGLTVYATDEESVDRASKTKALTPYGLGQNVQEFSNDNRSGRLMEVGKSFGLGSIGAASGYDLWPSASLNDVNVPSGLYWVNGTVADCPCAPENAVVIHRQVGSGGGQILIPFIGGLMHRGRRSGEYRDWATALNVRDYGLGGGTVAPPNGRDGVNPFGLYYKGNPPPSWGGGAIFLEMPYGINLNAGMRLSTDPYTDNFYLQGGISGKKEYRPVCVIWHSKNFDPDSKASQSSLDDLKKDVAKKVSTTGDTSLTGNFATEGEFYATRITGGGKWADKKPVTMIDKDGLFLQSTINRHVFAKFGSALVLSRYSATGVGQSEVFRVDEEDHVGFAKRPSAESKPLAFRDEATTAWDSIGSVALMAHNGTDQFLPGSTLSGAFLRLSNVTADPSGWVGSGTWRCQGFVPSSSYLNERVTLWQRIA